MTIQSRRHGNCQEIIATLQEPFKAWVSFVEINAENPQWTAVLKAINPNKEKADIICGYASGTFKIHEKNYCAQEKEILAIKNGMMTFKIHHLPKRFLIRTDTNLAGFLKSDLPKAMSQSEIQRLHAWFGEWQFKIEHVKGKENCLPNAVTREMAYKCRSKIIPRQEDKKRMPPMQEANGKASRYLGEKPATMLQHTNNQNVTYGPSYSLF